MHATDQCMAWASPCNTTATHCNTTATSPQHYCDTKISVRQARSRGLYSLQHTVTHCNTLQHAATRCNTRQHTATRRSEHEGEREVEAFMRSIPICSPRKKHITGNISYFSQVSLLLDLLYTRTIQPTFQNYYLWYAAM